jgi:oligopeptide transport system permease protein
MSGGRLLRRCGALLLTVLVVHALAFLLVRGTRGGPFDEERELAPEVRAALEKRFGLQRPLHQQYLAALAGLVRCDFGPSLRYRDTSVRAILADSLPVSLAVGAGALTLALLLGVTAGLGAAQRGGFAEALVLGGSTLLLALPGFVLAGAAVLCFAFRLDWLPPAGFGGVRHLLLPWLCLGLPLAAQIARLAHGGASVVLASAAVRAARARGLSRRAVLRHHVLRPALVPVAAFFGPAAAAALTGSLVIEQVFALPGLGTHFVQAALNRDFTLALGATVVFTALLGLCTLLADLMLARLDPRVEALT